MDFGTPLIVAKAEDAYDSLPAPNTNFVRGSANDPNVVATQLSAVHMGDQIYGNDEVAKTASMPRGSSLPTPASAMSSKFGKSSGSAPKAINTAPIYGNETAIQQQQQPTTTTRRGAAAPAITVRTEGMYGNQEVVDAHRK